MKNKPAPAPSGKQSRRRTFIDRPIQGTLVVRVVLYWLVSMLVQALLVAFLAIISGSGDDVHVRANEFWWHLKLVAFSSLCILPLLTMDMIKLSHRWVGPVYRLRAALQALARGEQQPPLQFREGDFWRELANDFNEAARRINSNCATTPRTELPVVHELLAKAKPDEVVAN